MTTVPFDRVGHLVRVPARLGGDELRFLVDTGIGVTVVNERVVARDDVVHLGETYAGRRMSGQLVEAPLVRLPALTVGDWSVPGHVAAVVDLGEGFDGILGPSYFGDRIVTTDPAASTFTVHDADATVDGVVVPLELHRDGPSVDPFVALVLPSGRTVRVEVDTGSGHLVLDARFMAECGVDPDGAEVTAHRGTDETGHGYLRYAATLAGAVHLAAAPETAQHRPEAIFQEIIHDGLVGSDYLYRYRFSFDVAGARMILGELSAPPAP
jgi:predicted aspartyl protease